MEAGSVSGVTVRPELVDYPVEVKLTLDTSYDLPIPGDSLAVLSTEGILGPTFVEIDTRFAHGARLANGGVLKSSELSADPTSRAFDRLTETIKALEKKVEDEKLTEAKPTTPGQTKPAK